MGDVKNMQLLVLHHRNENPECLIRFSEVIYKNEINAKVNRIFVNLESYVQDRYENQGMGFLKLSERGLTKSINSVNAQYTYIGQILMSGEMNRVREIVDKIDSNLLNESYVDKVLSFINKTTKISKEMFIEQMIDSGIALEFKKVPWIDIYDTIESFAEAVVSISRDEKTGKLGYWQDIKETIISYEEKPMVIPLSSVTPNRNLPENNLPIKNIDQKLLQNSLPDCILVDKKYIAKDLDNYNDEDWRKLVMSILQTKANECNISSFILTRVSNENSINNQIGGLTF